VKVTKRQLKKIIKEELEAAIQEGAYEWFAQPMRNAYRQAIGASEAAGEIADSSRQAIKWLDSLAKLGHKDKHHAKKAYEEAYKAESAARIYMDGLFNSPELTAALEQFGDPRRQMSGNIEGRIEATDALRAALVDLQRRAHDHREGRAYTGEPATGPHLKYGETEGN